MPCQKSRSFKRDAYMFSVNMIGDFFLWGFAFIFSTTLHEASHAFAAKFGGDMTAYSVGQASLNPLPHIKREPFGMVLFPILTFFLNGGGWMIGWASAPYDPNWAARYPKRSALMALAGPASNTVLMLISFALLKMGMSAGVLSLVEETGTIWDVVSQLLFIMLNLNLILAIFNLIPFPPLDGSEVVLLFVPEDRAHLVREKIQSLGIFGLIIAWLAFPYIYAPVAKVIFSLL